MRSKSYTGGLAMTVAPCSQQRTNCHPCGRAIYAGRLFRVYADEKEVRDTFVVFVCRNCRRSVKKYAISYRYSLAADRRETR
jgi:RNase P subunit RPR2